eukprot:3205164-Amphidinium_carterae.1
MIINRSVVQGASFCVMAAFISNGKLDATQQFEKLQDRSLQVSLFLFGLHGKVIRWQRSSGLPEGLERPRMLLTSPTLIFSAATLLCTDSNVRVVCVRVPGAGDQLD